MGTPFKPSRSICSWFFICVLLLTGCKTNFSQVFTGPQDPSSLPPGEPSEEKIAALHDPPQHENETNTRREIGEPPTPAVSRQAAEDCPPPASPEPPERTDQQRLDSALEFCQASYDFWERGDLENAIDALDQAYSLILKIDPNREPEIAQQRDDLRITIAKRIIEVYSSRYTVANGQNNAIPLVVNEHVKKALELYKGPRREVFLRAYRRSGRYRPAILEALREAGLPEELSWLPLIESGFKVRALSRSRALGLWQFIASTGYKYGLERNRWIDERMDPEKSTEAAIAYLKELHRIFGDWETVLAAYNCGEGRVLRCIRRQKINYLDNFWDLYKSLPVETAFYVPKFLAVLHILADPGAHGFDLPAVEEPVGSEKVTIDKQLHLKTVGKHLEVSYATLKQLNPELRRNFTPNKPYAIRVPAGKGEVLLSGLDDIPAWRPPTPSYVIHRVRRGESLSVIARRYRTSVRSIMAMNGLRSKHYIKAGWRLKIPSRGTTTAHLRSSTAKTKGSATRYVVQKGDALWKIAKRYGTTTQAIQTMNHLKGSRLQIGQVLKIPRVEPGFDMKTRPYTVSKGDSPYSIARRYHMNLSDFLRINHLTPRSTIFPGQVLMVKAQ